MSRPRVFFHVQHLLGIGHLRRAATIARALDRAGLAVAFVSGGEPMPGLDLGGAELIQLPAARAGDSGFGSILDAAGRPIDDGWRDRRRRVLLGAFAALAPDVLLIELYPFGRRPFRFELEPLLAAAAARRPRPAVACSVRDILVDKSEPRRNAEIVEIVRRDFDRILVHGNPRLVTFGQTFPAAAAIADKLCYTGYVVGEPPTDAEGDAGTGEVLVSAGGGAVGASLLQTALAARPLTRLADRPWRLLTGINLPREAFATLAAASPSGVTVERFRPDFQTLLKNCRLSVSQAGYNTVMEILAARTRAVVVPFADGSETEQSLRASLLAQRGLLTVVEPASLSAATLAAGIDAADAATPPAAAAPDLDGAAGTVRAIRELLRRAGDRVATGSPPGSA